MSDISLQQFRYNITKEDLYLTKFPYTKVLQQKYVVGKDNLILDEFKDQIRMLLRSRDYILLSIEDINTLIYSFVRELQNKYPEDFEVVGWYTKQVLAYLFIEGKLRYEGEPVRTKELLLFEAENEKRIYEQLEQNRRKEFLHKQEVAKEKEKEIKRKEKARIPIQEGMLISSKEKLIAAYKESMPSEVKNGRQRWEFVLTYIDVEYSASKGGWTVVKVNKEGGRLWT